MWALDSSYSQRSPNDAAEQGFIVWLDCHHDGSSQMIFAAHCMPGCLQILIFQALGFTPPVFGHLSLILAPDRSKMSKRHGATSVTEFRGLGYMPQVHLLLVAAACTTCALGSTGKAAAWPVLSWLLIACPIVVPDPPHFGPCICMLKKV